MAPKPVCCQPKRWQNTPRATKPKAIKHSLSGGHKAAQTDVVALGCCGLFNAHREKNTAALVLPAYTAAVLSTATPCAKWLSTSPDFTPITHNMPHITGVMPYLAKRTCAAFMFLPSKNPRAKVRKIGKSAANKLLRANNTKHLWG